MEVHRYEVQYMDEYTFYIIVLRASALIDKITTWNVDGGVGFFLLHCSLANRTWEPKEA